MSEIQNVTTLREATNSVKINGVLKEKTFREGTNKNGIPTIAATFVILTGKDSEIKVSTRPQNQTTKDGKESSLYKGLKTIQENADGNFSTVADFMAHGLSREDAIQQAAKVYTNGRLTLNEFVGRDGNLARSIQVEVTGLHHVFNTDTAKPGAEFEIEGYVEKKRHEMVDGEETGRLILDCIIPIYGGRVVPMSFFVTTENSTSEQMDDNYNVGDTVYIWGEYVSTVKVTKVKKEGFGMARESEYTTRKQELVVTGGKEALDEDNPKRFSPAAIKAAVQVRETEYLPSLKERNANKTASAGNSFGANTYTAPRPATVPSASPFSMDI